MQAVRTLYVRNVPDDVMADVEELAEREGLSVNAFLLKELSLLAGRSRNARLFAALPSLPNVDPEQTAKDIRAGRAERDRHIARVLDEVRKRAERDRR